MWQDLSFLYIPEVNCEAYADYPFVSEGNAPSLSTSKERMSIPSVEHPRKRLAWIKGHVVQTI